MRCYWIRGSLFMRCVVVSYCSYVGLCVCYNVVCKVGGR